MRIVIKMKNGSVKEFKETSRSGGSWCTSIKYKDAFAIVSNAYGEETAIPAEDIEEIKTYPRATW